MEEPNQGEKPALKAKLFKCCYCSNEFVDNTERYKHYKHCNEKAKRQGNQRKLTCTKCQNDFLARQAFIEHKPRCKGKISTGKQCSKCNRYVTLNKHKKTSE